VNVVTRLLDGTPACRRVISPRAMHLVGLVVALFMAVVAMGFFVALFTVEERPPWYAYPLVAAGIVLFLSATATFFGSGVYVHAGGVGIVNPLSLRRLPWEQLTRFSLDPWPYCWGRAHLRRGGSITLWGIRWVVAPDEAQAAIDRLNDALRTGQGNGTPGHEP
jgi:hypothetical protein